MADAEKDGQATAKQLSQARAICENNPLLRAELEAFQNTQPSRSQMYEFIESLRDPTRQKERFDASIMQVCKLVGITEPTPGERLLALQVGLLQDQNAALAVIINKLDPPNSQPQTQSIFTPFLTEILVGEINSR